MKGSPGTLLDVVASADCQKWIPPTKIWNLDCYSDEFFLSPLEFMGHVTTVSCHWVHWMASLAFDFSTLVCTMQCLLQTLLRQRWLPNMDGMMSTMADPLELLGKKT